MSNSKEVTLFSLGIEELAMSLGIINRADLGRELLSSIYDNLSEDQIDARLSSASHSLLARGLVAISKSGSPILESRLEQAIFPLARFDSLLQVSLVKDDRQVGSTIHIQKDKAFTSHSIQGGVVHVLEHGSYKNLSGFVGDVFNGTEMKGKATGVADWTVTPGILGEAVRMNKDQKGIQELLKNNDVPDSDAKMLSEDLASEKSRATLLKIKADHSLHMDAIKKAPKEMLMYLQGDKRSWVFNFSSTEDSAKGKCQSVDTAQFKKVLTAFIS